MTKRLWPLLIALLTAGCASLFFRPGQYRVIAYVFGPSGLDIARIDAAKLTHINYAFGVVSAEGDVVFNQADGPSYLAQLQALKARNPRLKILLSIGGWGADNFSDAALTEQSRERFALSAITMLRRYALDGLDLDWEYPGQAGPGIKFRPEDKQNFTLLLAKLRAHLDRLSDARGLRGNDRYALTIASSAGIYFQHTEMETLHRHLDWINIMTYDFNGEWSATTGHHTNLLGAGRSVDAFVKQHLAAGIPAKKLVVGAAFYGRAWNGVNSANRGLNQSAEKYDDEYPWSRLAREFTPAQGFERHWDDEAKAPFLWNPTTRTFVTYDDPVSLREKARYVKRHRLGGMMYWEHSHDPDNVLLDAIYRELGR